MEFLLWFTLLFLTALIFFFFFPRTRKSKSYRLPPGPPGVPIFGNLFDLGPEPYKTIAGMKEKYGPIVWLRIGCINTMVIQTAEVAGELFKNYDVSFAGRQIAEVHRVHDFVSGSVALAQYGPYWRVLRRICTVEMFTTKKINETAGVRRKCVDDMVAWVEKEARETTDHGKGIHVARFVFLASFNMVGNMILSRDLVDPESETAKEFFDAMMGIMELAGRPNVSDIFPWLKRFDLQGVKREMERDLGKAMEIAAGFLRERMEEVKLGGEKKKQDFLNVLLEFRGSGKDEPSKLSQHQILIFILEMFFAGTETSSSTVEWAMTELLRKSEAFAKAKAEISEVVGSTRKLEESDIKNLPYLQAVIKETLRLHPPVPLLVPRKGYEDIKFMGYDIPQGTQVYINAWAIGRDPQYWEDPLEFKPERFLDSKIDFKGQHFELIPFGSGRRVCVGLSLGNRMAHFVLGSLLREFDWELDHAIDPKNMDMRERMGSTVRKLQPLQAIPKRKC
ncbi:PREDICTED: cytochrome P450 76A1-like [Ipomoea nil]|uniref:cytochrome P450 76A1-like n=1 Tax=Ipomoea nil TaxID=35883 RepID=UPI00090117E3|nr:PREDICTED: cytochrome P450 76A1-like [Ipomoea nil]